MSRSITHVSSYTSGQPAGNPLERGLVALLLPTKELKETWVGIAQSVQRFATGWTVRGSNPGGRRDFPRLSRPTLCPSSLLQIGYRVFLGD